MHFAAGIARSRRPAGLLAALGLAASLAPTAAPAQAQQRPQGQRPAAPAQQQQAQPQQPQPQQPQAQPNPAGQPAQAGPTIVQVKSEPSQPEWTKVCGKDPASNAEICYTTRDFVSDQGQPVLAVAVYDAKGGPQAQKIARFLMPLGLMLRPGIRFAVDQGQATPGQFAICFPNGCFAETTGLKDDLINQMKRGTSLNVSVQNQVGREVTFAVPLAGFGKTWDGPAIDPKVLEGQQKKLQEELEKRSDELRKRLEQSGQVAAPAAPGAAAPAAR